MVSVSCFDHDLRYKSHANTIVMPAILCEPLGALASGSQCGLCWCRLPLCWRRGATLLNSLQHWVGCGLTCTIFGLLSRPALVGDYGISGAAAPVILVFICVRVPQTAVDAWLGPRFAPLVPPCCCWRRGELWDLSAIALPYRCRCRPPIGLSILGPACYWARVIILLHCPVVHVDHMDSHFLHCPLAPAEYQVRFLVAWWTVGS